MIRTAVLLLLLSGCAEPVDVRGQSMYDACDNAIDAGDRNAAFRECGRADQYAAMLGIEPTAKMRSRRQREFELGSVSAEITSVIAPDCVFVAHADRTTVTCNSPGPE